MSSETDRDVTGPNTSSHQTKDQDAILDEVQKLKIKERAAEPGRMGAESDLSRMKQSQRGKVPESIVNALKKISPQVFFAKEAYS